MKLLVQTGIRSGTNIPILRRVNIRVSPSDANAIGRIATDVNNHRNPLLRDTKMKSGYEKVFADCFLDLGVAVDYEPFSLFVGKQGGIDITYTPDFVTDLKINGRRVIIEPHGMKFRSQGDIELGITKLGLFKMSYKNQFYLIIASDLAHEVLKFRVCNNLDRIIDEYWETPSDRKEEREHVMGRVRELLLRVQHR